MEERQMERRKHKRVRKPFMISFQISSGKEEEKEFSGWDMVAVLNMGAGGALFYYTRKLRVGTTLDMKINISTAKDPIRCTGKVIRAEKLLNEYMFLTAVVFAEIDERERKIINDFAEAYCPGRTR
ncbi:MAG: PilZ domain-containing protein [Candidatus Omnitrophota bacterium]